MGHGNKRGPPDSTLGAVTQADQWRTTTVGGKRRNGHKGQRVPKDSDGVFPPQKEESHHPLGFRLKSRRGNEKRYLLSLFKNTGECVFFYFERQTGCLTSATLFCCLPPPSTHYCQEPINEKNYQVNTGEGCSLKDKQCKAKVCLAS